MADLYDAGTRCKKGVAGLSGMSNNDIKDLLKDYGVSFTSKDNRAALAKLVYDNRDVITEDVLSSSAPAPAASSSSSRSGSSTRRAAPAAKKSSTTLLPGVTVVMMKDALKENDIAFKSTMKRVELANLVLDNDIEIEPKSPAKKTSKAASSSTSRARPGVPSRQTAPPPAFKMELPRFDSISSKGEETALGNVSWDLGKPFFEGSELYNPSPITKYFLENKANIGPATLKQMLAELDFSRPLVPANEDELYNTFFFPQTNDVVVSGVPGETKPITIQHPDGVTYGDLVFGLEEYLASQRGSLKGTIFRGLRALDKTGVRYELILEQAEVHEEDREEHGDAEEVYDEDTDQEPAEGSYQEEEEDLPNL